MFCWLPRKFSQHILILFLTIQGPQYLDDAYITPAAACAVVSENLPCNTTREDANTRKKNAHTFSKKAFVQSWFYSGCP